MDILYILGKGSPRNDLELLFSLRSLKKHMGDMGKVFIVGEKPTWLKGVVHIPCLDPYEKHWQNALFKIKKACADERISETFLLMNDDFFMNKYFLGSEYPFYTRRGHEGGVNGALSFAVHAPMQINKSFFIQLPIEPTQKGDWSPRSFYGNFFKASPTPCDDFVLNVDHPAIDIHKVTLTMPCFSTGHNAILFDNFLTLLMSYYPEATEFEEYDVIGTEFLFPDNEVV
jgi:hypothetical protein